MSDSNKNITVYVSVQNESKAVNISPGDTVKELRAAAAASLEADGSELRLIIGGRLLRDEETLQAAGIGAEQLVHAVAAPSAAAASLPMPSLFRCGVDAGASLADMQSQMQRQMLQQPQAMRQLLENPLVQSVMADPDAMRAMLLANPQLRRLAEANRELASLLGDADVLQQTAALARSSAAMAELSAGYDRALSARQDSGGFAGEQRPAPPADESLSRNPFASSAAGCRPTGAEEQQQQQQLLRSNADLVAQAMQSSYMQPMLQAFAADQQLAESVLVNSPPVAADPQAQQQLRRMLPQVVAQMASPRTQAAVSNPRALQALLQLQENVRVLRQEAPGLLPDNEVQQTPTTDEKQQQQEQQQHQSAMASLMQSVLTTLSTHGSDGSDPTLPPEQRYSPQLQELAGMGFANREANLRAVQATLGDVRAAVDRLLLLPGGQ